jgi:hypothetical protein
MSPIELLSWRIDTNGLRLLVEAFVEDVEELPRHDGDCQSDYVNARCEASILLGEISDWPETMEERLVFLEHFAEWKVIDDGEE